MPLPYVYFDSAATSAPCPEALDMLTRAASEYGNPSAEHCAGRAARALVEESREAVASAVGCSPEELFFTSSGTEASNTALFGLAKSRKRFGNVILTTDSEHPSVREPLKRLEEEGFRVLRLTTKNGRLDENEVREAARLPIAFVTIMQANNETGAVYDLRMVRRVLSDAGNGAPVHCDAVQSFLKIPNNRLPSFCDAATVSAHKIGGVKGAAALYVRKGIRIPALLLGGGQESALRSGTEAVPAIAAFGAAVRAKVLDPERLAVMEQTRAFLADALSNIGMKLHEPECRLPNLIHLSVPGVKSSWALNALSAKGICVSAGSACSSKKKDNPVLAAYGLPKEEAETSLRISFTENTTKDECLLLVGALREAAKLKR
ncbi:MAG: cysteine desulfurase [Clostridia bacterium]|nr:cysteine desulfurase [Clostridia bacterium]